MACDNAKCGCRNRAEFNPCGELLPCCTYCPDGAPCAYAIVSPCRWSRDCVFLNRVTPLWKDCLFGNTWSARAMKPEKLGVTACADLQRFIDPGNSACDGDSQVSIGSEFPPSGCPDECGHGGRIVQISPPVCYESGDYKASKLKFSCERMPNNSMLQAYRCGWNDWYQQNYACALGPNYWADMLDTCARIIWQLEITGADTATLKVYGCEGTSTVLVATYSCNSWKCIPEGTGEGDHGNTFTMQDYPCIDYPELPKYLCIVPYSSDWQTYCNPPEKACSCGDPGWNQFCLDLTTLNCGNLPDSATLTRYLSGGFTDGTNDLSGSISAPSPAPCGYFTGTTANQCDDATDNSSLFFTVWCDGDDWNVRIHCIMYSGHTQTISSITEICNTTFTVTEICPDGMRGTSDCGTITSDCCQECTITVCDCDIPTTLHVDITSVTCPGINTSFDIVYDGASPYGAGWYATGVTMPGCDPKTFSFTASGTAGSCMTAIQLGLVPEATCLAGGDLFALSCPFVSHTYDATESSGASGCSCLSGCFDVQITVSA